MTAPVAGSAGGWSDAAGLAVPRGSPHKAVSRLYMRGLKHEAFPCQEAEAVPLDTLLQVLDCVEKEVARGGRVAVHCRAGRGRTATVLAGYIMQVSSQYCILNIVKHGLHVCCR